MQVAPKSTVDPSPVSKSHALEVSEPKYEDVSHPTPQCHDLPAQSMTSTSTNTIDNNPMGDDYEPSNREFYPALVLKLLSLPLMEVIVDVVRTQPLTASNEMIEKELLLRLVEEIADENSPWYGFRAQGPAISGERTAEHYLSALDVALAARLGLKNARKVAKFWKKIALHIDPTAITPSPSDISDTGISPNLSVRRQEELDSLIRKRAAMEQKTGGVSAEHGLMQKPTKCAVAEVKHSENRKGSESQLPDEHRAGAKPDDSVCVGDITLVNDSSQRGSSSDKEGKVTMPAHEGFFTIGRRPSDAKSLIPRRMSSAKSPDMSTLSSTSVQTKRILFENLSRAASCPPRASARKPVGTKTPTLSKAHRPGSQPVKKPPFRV